MESRDSGREGVMKWLVIASLSGFLIGFSLAGLYVLFEKYKER